MKRAILPAVVVLLAVPSVARAELVRLTTGRVMSVESCRFEGESVVLSLRSGGEISLPRSVVADVAADEVPHPKALSLELVAPPPPVGALTPLGAIRGLVDKLATLYSVDLKLAHAVVQTESNYDPRAVSGKGAMGLMQIMPDVARLYSVADPFDPETNLTAGLRYLRSMIDRFPSDLPRALAAYNAGEGAVAHFGGVPPYPETQQYIRRVLTLVGRH